MRITALIRPDSVNADYRARIPLVALERRGHDVRLESAYSITSASRYMDRDVVLFCRVWEAPAMHLARALRRQGIGVVWDSDDDLISIPRGNPGYRMFGGLRGKRIFAEMTTIMRLAGVVTTPSEVLADLFYEASGTEVRMIENYLAPPMILGAPPRHSGNGKVVVGWVAGNEHQVDVEQLRLRPLFEDLLEAIPFLEVVSVGHRLGLRSDRYRYIRGVQLGDLVNTIATFDIGIAPLVDIPFNRSRSNIKVKEYAGAGVPWLASDLDPYRGLGEEQGGRLVAAGGWRAEITRLVVDATARSRLAAAAARWAKGQTILLHDRPWERVFQEASAYARASVGAV